MAEQAIGLLDLIGEASARSAGVPDVLVDPLVDVACELLQEQGELDEFLPLDSSGIKGAGLSAFHYEEEENRLDLVTVASSSDGKLGAVELRRTIQKAVKVIEAIRSAVPEDLEKEGMLELHDLLSQAVNRTTRIRLFVLSAGVATRGLELEEPIKWRTHELELRLWDRNRLELLLGSGIPRQGIRVDFSEIEDAEGGLLLLHSGDENPVYDTYLTFMPGKVLASIYKAFGSRLLERNVRSFLQVKGKVNKGIRETIRLDPVMFLAYNNGISATVTELEGEWEGEALRATAMVDFQIVNGGQTTASLAKAMQDGLDLDGISVQVKLAHIKGTDKEREDELVANIAKFANSQNKVRDTDLASSLSFFRHLEALSREIWAPPRRGETGLTRWFFERSRGQYLTERNAVAKGAKQNAFLKENPRSQLITASDVAKFEHIWDCRPHDVSKGAQKNFLRFQDMVEDRKMVPDAAWFRRLVGKAILFRVTDDVIRQQNFGGYKANITAYTLSWVAHRTGRGIDLESVWRAQEAPEGFVRIVAKASHAVDAILRDSQSRNVTENAKRSMVWDRVSEDDLGLDKEDLDWLAAWKSRVTESDHTQKLAELTDEERRMVQKVMDRSGAYWMEMVTWAKRTNVLQGWQRSMLFNVAKRLQSGQIPTHKQAKQALLAQDEAEAKGFTQ